MKKHTILFLSIILVTFYSYAQAPRGFYVAAGYSQTSLKSDDLLSKSNPGFYAGLNCQMGYHETHNYQMELLYRQNTLGLNYVEGGFTEAKTTNFNLSNIELGFYFNYYILKPEEDQFFFGPQAGVFAAYVDSLTPSKGADVNGQYYLPYLLDEMALQSTNNFNYGFGLGLTGGYNKFRFDFRYSLGMANFLSDVETNSYDSSNRYTGPSLEGKTNNISFGVSYNLLARSKK